MERRNWLQTPLIVALVLVFTTSYAQVLSAPKDPTASAVAQRSLSAMGSSHLSGRPTVEMAGTLTLAGSTPSSFPLLIKARGTSQLRCELTTKKGIRVTVTTNGHGGIRQPDGSIRWLADENLTGQRNLNVPVLSLISEYHLPTTSVDYVGLANVDGVAADVIALGVYSGASDVQAQKLAQNTRTLVYVDHTTGYVLRIQQLHYAENVRNSSQRLETRYSDYRHVSGIMVPFHQQTYADGRLLFDLVVNSVTFGAQLTDSDFTLAQ